MDLVLDQVRIHSGVWNAVTIAIWPKNVLKAVLLVDPLGERENQLLTRGRR